MTNSDFDSGQTDRYKGIRGWLLLFCLIVIVFNPLGNIALMILEFKQAGPYFDKFPKLHDITIMSNMATIVMMAFSIYAGISLWTMKRNAVAIAKGYLRLYMCLVVFQAILPLLAGFPPEAIEDLIH